MKKMTITFNDEQLKEALAKYFKISKKKITFWYIRSCLGNNHTLEYMENLK
jgi:hypothetical protein